MKTLAIIVMVALVSIGCAGVQLDNAALTEVAIKDAAMIAGYKLAQSQPATAKAALPYAAAMLEAANSGKISAAIWGQGIALLVEQIGGDPLLTALVADVTSLIVIKEGAVDDVTQGNIKVALKGFVAGLTLAQAR